MVVVLDWDAAKKVKSTQEILPDAHTYSVVAWPEAEANPRLPKTFRGVERFYSDRLVQLAENQDVGIGRDGHHNVVVGPEDYRKRIKPALAKIVESNLQEEDLQYARGFLQKLVPLLQRR